MTYLKLKYISVVGLLIMITVSCKKDEFVPFLDCTTVEVDLSQTNPADCSQPTGEIAMTVSGGAEPYSFTLNGLTNSSGIFSGLYNGKYRVEVKDAQPCTQLVDVTLSTPGATLSATSTGSASTQCAPESNGTIRITASGGTPPYEYQRGTAGFQMLDTFSDLEPSEYQVSVKDANDCIYVLTATVPGMSYNTIKPIIESNCTTTGCHNGDVAAHLNFLVFENVVENSRQIRTSVENKTMPPSGSLSESQIELISCWVSEGANM